MQWSPTGTNVPDYPKLAQLWWQNIGDAAAGAKTPQQAMDGLCDAQEQLMGRLEKSGVQGDKGPKLGEVKTAQYWFDQPGAPKPKLANEKPKQITVDYDETEPIVDIDDSRAEVARNPYEMDLLRGDVEAALVSYREAVMILTGVGSDREAAEMWFELAGLL